jgi:hypothetical protein
MLLTTGERAELHEVLQSAFPNQELLDMLVDQLERRPGNIPGGTITARVLNLINLADGQGFLEKLLTTAAEQPEQQDNIKLQAVTDSLLKRIRERAGARWLESEDPYQACFLHNSRPLVNRSTLRAAITALCSDEGIRVLVVNGDPISGKSYTLQYIVFLADKFGNDRVYIDIKDELQTSFGPDALARSIGLQLNLSPEEIRSIPASPQNARWVMDIRDWIIGASKRNGALWWIILDGFDHPDLPPETHQLIEHLMLHVEKVKPPVRLVLLSYRRPIPRDIRRDIKDETIAPIDRLELAEFFQRLYQLSNKTVTPDDLKQIVDKVLDLVPAGDPERLYSLAEAVEKTAQRLFPREA